MLRSDAVERAHSRGDRGTGPGAARRNACGARGAYLVGGAARSLVSGRAPDRDVDIAVEADLDPLLEGLEIDEGTRRHERFGTATVPLPGRPPRRSGEDPHRDLRGARAPCRRSGRPRSTRISRGATSRVNAIAIALDPPHDVLDPFSGAADLEAGMLRALHADSFLDDPTRAIRGARYCARLGLEPGRGRRSALLTRADLGSVSADRRRAELGRLAEEAEAPGWIRPALGSWGALEVAPGRPGADRRDRCRRGRRRRPLDRRRRERRRSWPRPRGARRRDRGPGAGRRRCRRAPPRGSSSPPARRSRRCSSPAPPAPTGSSRTCGNGGTSASRSAART